MQRTRERLWRTGQAFAGVERFAPNGVIPRSAAPNSLDAPWPGASLRVSLRRLAYLWATAWLGLGTVSIGLTADNAFHHRFVVIATLSIALAVCLLLIPVGTKADPLLVATLALASAIAGVSMTGAEYVGAEPQIIFWLPNLVAISAGLLLRPKIAALITVLVALGSGGLILWILSNSPTRYAVLDAAGSITYALFDGFAAIVAVRALRRAAWAVDTSVAASQRSHESLELIKAVGAETREIGRIVHDTAINTLSSIAKGTYVDGKAIAIQCGKDAQIIQRLLEHGVSGIRHTSPTWQSVIDAVPLMVELTGVTKPEIDEIFAELPPEVAHSVCGALRESLRNAQKHGGVDYAEVTVGINPIRFTVTDSGRGFAGPYPEDHGLARSVRDRCEEVGITCVVESVPGEGTAVRLVCPSSEKVLPIAEQNQAIQRFQQDIAQSFVWKFSLYIVLLCSTMTALTWTAGSAATSGVAALSLLGCLVSARWRYRGTDLPRAAIILLLALLPLIVVLPGSSVEGCARVAMSWWGTDGALLPLTLLVFLVRSRWPLLVGACIYGGSTSVVLFQVGVANGCASSAVSGALLDASIILGMEVFRVSLQGLAVRTDSEQRQAAAAAIRSAAQAAKIRVLGARRNTVLRSSLELLQRLALEGVDGSHEVQTACAREESYLREVTLLSPDMSHFGDVLAHALSLAHRRGVSLRLRTGDLDLPSSEVGDEVSDLLTRVIEDLEWGDTCTVSLIERDNEMVLTIVATRETEMSLSSQQWPRSGRLLESVSPEQAYVQLRWRSDD